MPAQLNLIGEKFTRLTVIGKDKTKKYYYWCKCDCGAVKSIASKSLCSGRTKSCGCLKTELLKERTIDADKRFWQKVNKSGPLPEYDTSLGNCWIWTSAQDSHGYGTFHFGERNSVIKAHRYSFMTQIGKLPTNMELDHKCRVTLCIRPNHLELVTHKENIRRGVYARNSGKCPKGLHEMMGSNIYINPTTGKPRCRSCRDEYRRKYYLEKHDNRNTKKMLQ